MDIPTLQCLLPGEVLMGLGGNFHQNIIKEKLRQMFT